MFHKNHVTEGVKQFWFSGRTWWHLRDDRYGGCYVRDPSDSVVRHGRRARHCRQPRAGAEFTGKTDWSARARHAGFGSLTFCGPRKRVRTRPRRSACERCPLDVDIIIRLTKDSCRCYWCRVWIPEYWIFFYFFLAIDFFMDDDETWNRFIEGISTSCLRRNR